ncbi:hypothetical protein [Prauserella shujinwangii]|uniref:hypothetical protein n=1 Tax=Prauserella shujinwangii TaxID=1453103 RepID=UPI0015E5C121|nr:hypothetical protein [Prauserella shujinwangii]
MPGGGPLGHRQHQRHLLRHIPRRTSQPAILRQRLQQQRLIARHPCGELLSPAQQTLFGDTGTTVSVIGSPQPK